MLRCAVRQSLMIKKRITWCTKILSNNVVAFVSSRFASCVSAKKQKVFRFSGSWLFPRAVFRSQSFSLSLSPICTEDSRTDRRGGGNAPKSFFCFWLDFAAIPLSSSGVRVPPSPPSPSSPLVHPLRASSTSRFPRDACRRRGYFAMEDSTSIRYIPARIHYRLAEQYTRECITLTHPPPLDVYIPDCDLRYRKLLSRARPKTPGGRIKFLNSDMTATTRRCLLPSWEVGDLFSSDLSRKQASCIRSGKVNFTLRLSAKRANRTSVNRDALDPWARWKHRDPWKEERGNVKMRGNIKSTRVYKAEVYARGGMRLWVTLGNIAN